MALASAFTSPSRSPSPTVATSASIQQTRPERNSRWSCLVGLNPQSALKLVQLGERSSLSSLVPITVFVSDILGRLMLAFPLWPPLALGLAIFFYVKHRHRVGVDRMPLGLYVVAVLVCSGGAWALGVFYGI